MNTRWTVLSEWHNAWLTADPDERERLRDRLGREYPGLQDEADSLASASAGLQGFLDTPAIVVAAPLLADDTLAAGTTVGPYEIVELVARGGMGDVYRASDPRLGRDVAIKVLTQTDADATGVHRFIQEARVTASLDHPNIVRVYDVGMFQAKPFLVAELLDGETLGSRITRGAVSTPEAAAITAQVASGLVAAHGAGLVHRDLKPDNIFLTRSGVTKILDFGIAKLAYDGIGSDSGRTLSGVLLGTAGYLAPEQVRGEPVDARSDLFALGAIAFEMVTGRRAFVGDHTIDTLHAIAHDPPPDAEAFGDVPAGFASIVIRLLQKEPGARFQSAALLLEALDAVGEPQRGVVAAPRLRTDRRWARHRSAAARLVLALAAAGTLVAVGMRIGSGPSSAAPDIPLTRVEWTLPPGMWLDSSPVVSPDGRRVAFIGMDKSGARLMVRGLADLSARAIPGTDGAKQPFWSPASDAIGYFANQKLMKVGLTDSGPIELADAPDARGGAWSRNGTIVFAPDLIETALLQVPAGGGTPLPATRLDVSRQDNSHRWPAFLPDDVSFLFFVRAEPTSRRGVYVGRLDRAALPGTPLLKSESEALYVPTSAADSGHLLYVADGRLQARPFDAARLAFSGDARILASPSGGNTLYHPSMFSASRDVLAFVASPVPYGVRLGSVGRDGSSLRLSDVSEAQNWPRLSPDGKWLARQRIDGRQGNPDIWVQHLELGTSVRVTTSSHPDILPVWSPDGRQLAYVSDWRGTSAVAIANADGTGVVRTIPCPGMSCETTDWSRNGEELIVTVRTRAGTDVWSVRPDAAAARPILADAVDERDARLSPDGELIAYVSDESGRPQVSVRERGAGRQRIVISSAGGSQPVWREARELFFVDPAGRLSSATIRRTADGRLTHGAPVVLPVPLIGAGHWNTQYDVSPDGRRVHFMDRPSERPSTVINLVLGWRALLQ